MPSNLRFLYDVGQTIPGTNYKVLAHLGIGGMGSVYEVVEPPRDDQPFVLKAVHPQLLAGTRVRDQLLKESNTLLKLQHDNIVRVLGSGETGSDPAIPYYLMERLRGHTLGRALRRLRSKGRWLPLSRAFTIMAGVLSALAYAHDQGVIHRDVKAENIFLHQRSDGRICIKLVDFGITQMVAEARASMGSIVGAFGAAAPELLRREELTPACDIYASGVLLYEMLCWHHPFGEFGDDRELVEAHLSSEPVPLSTWRAVPHALDELILRMLEKDPKRRPDGASALSSLDRIRRELSRTNTLELYDPPSTKMPIAPIAVPPSAGTGRVDVWESPTGHIIGDSGHAAPDLERAELAPVPSQSPEPAVRLTPYAASDGSMGIRMQPLSAGAPSGGAPSGGAPAGPAPETPPFWGRGAEPTSVSPSTAAAPPVPRPDNGPATEPGLGERRAGGRPTPPTAPSHVSSPVAAPSHVAAPPVAAPSAVPAPPVARPSSASSLVTVSPAAGAPAASCAVGPAPPSGSLPVAAASGAAAEPPVSPKSAHASGEYARPSPGADTEVSRPKVHEPDDAKAGAPADEAPPSSRPPAPAASSAATIPRNASSNKAPGKLRWWLHPDANQPVPDWVQAAQAATPRSRIPIAVKRAAASLGMGMSLAFLVLAPTSGIWWPSAPPPPPPNAPNAPNALAAKPAALPLSLSPPERVPSRTSNTSTLAGTHVGSAPASPGPGTPAPTAPMPLPGAMPSPAEGRASRRAGDGPSPAVAQPAAPPRQAPRDPGKAKAPKVLGQELLDLP